MSQFEADVPPPGWRRWFGCLSIAIGAVAIAVGVLAGVVAGQAITDDWGTQAQEVEGDV